MTDVRLTATNPEDSSVVPVACNAKGELKLEEPIDNSFDGSLNGDLNVTGSAEFAGRTDIGSSSLNDDVGLKVVNNYAASGTATLYVQNFNDAGNLWSGRNGSNDETSAINADGSSSFAGTVVSGNAWADNDEGAVRLRSSPSGKNASVDVKGDANAVGCITVRQGGSELADAVAQINGDGSATFAGNIESGFNGGYASGVQLVSTGYFNIRQDNTSNDCFAVYSGSPVASNKNIGFQSSGSATFAGGKAGFTAEGYLWCTTRRGDTVILDATSGGVGSWAAYAGPTRVEQIKEQAEEWAEKDRVDPNFGVSPEDSAET